MRIDDAHGNTLNTRECSIHDDFLEKVDFNFEKREIVLSIERNYSINGNCATGRYTITFMNVVDFHITTCDFCEKASRIWEFYYVPHEERTFLPRLLQKKESYYASCYCNLNSAASFMEVVMKFTSLDEIIVVCEFVDFEYVIDSAI
ncbi:MAG: hypothetical protein HFG44_09125 [Oscillospiraceae bacterium]|nr:hypothetical protein [Oscillospiraceae bacterium]